jgi:hypothetical protein
MFENFDFCGRQLLKKFYSTKILKILAFLVDNFWKNCVTYKKIIKMFENFVFLSIICKKILKILEKNRRPPPFFWLLNNFEEKYDEGNFIYSILNHMNWLSRKVSKDARSTSKTTQVDKNLEKRV